MIRSLRRDPPSARMTVRRMGERGHYDRQTILDVLRAGMVCHVGIVEHGVPLVIPMAYGIMGGEIVLHGMAASRLQASLRSKAEVCVTVTVLDGVVLATSAFEHSMNYRSAVIVGRPRWLRDTASKLVALRAVSDQLVPGRWEDVRPPSAAELKQTHVCAISLHESSAKVRSGPPSADDEPWSTWTGVLPLGMVRGAPEPDAGATQPLPSYLAATMQTRVSPGEGPRAHSEDIDD